MVNEKQLVEACISYEKYYTRRLHETVPDSPEYYRYLRLLGENDIHMYDLEKIIRENNDMEALKILNNYYETLEKQ